MFYKTKYALKWPLAVIKPIVEINYDASYTSLRNRTAIKTVMSDICIVIHYLSMSIVHIIINICKFSCQYIEDLDKLFLTILHVLFSFLAFSICNFYSYQKLLKGGTF